ncbi:hypothetical protein [Pelagibius sp. 7325]|uniref:hypothetical protein n=1 Tax=Pelagibius sp. 7325 TaxID=3131994 RepID=UPI0030EF23C2
MRAIVAWTYTFFEYSKSLPSWWRPNGQPEVRRTVTYDHHIDVAEALTLLFWAQNAQDLALVDEATEEQPESMMRILFLCELLFAPEDCALLLDHQVTSGETVRDLLAAGAAGIARLEAVLTESFRDQAPREIYNQGGAAPCPVLELQFLLRLLEARREDDFQWRNPLSGNCEPIDAGDARLAQAVFSAGMKLDEGNLCELIVGALQDRAEVVRYIAARMVTSLSDASPVLSTLSQLSSDAIAFVRRAALETLSLVNSRADVVDSIAAFSHDPDPALRRLVVKLLLENEAMYCDYRRLIHLAFDPEPEIAKIARAYFSPSDIQRYLRLLAQLASRGGALHQRELEILAKPANLRRSLRRQVFIQRFSRLAPFRDAHQLARTVEALETCATDLDPSFWHEAAALVHDRTRPVVEQSLAMLHAKAKVGV